ncbi:M15 family metallopeptidase [Shewanella woodyi]|uniref:M15 family metallopeptidase n=1 Tax=Shewanella woodyi TaxID=60961 RepID=UPI0037499D8E
MLISPDALYGLDSEHLVDYQGHRLEPKTAQALASMTKAAKHQGIDIAVCSGHRHFNKQLQIWNAKAQGKRTLLDIDSRPVSIANKSQQEIVDLILLWSALPGTSRHHWGTDVDLYDASAITTSELRLVSCEYEDKGPCAPLHRWLVKHSYEFGFYFPFQAGLSGVSPEPWHLSYFPVANELLKGFDTGRINAILNDADVELKSAIIPKLPHIINEYVQRVAPAPSATDTI